MIIPKTTSDLQIFSNSTEFKTGIDPENIDFIVTILSSNLYSEPENSFIRETVSNAYDSHIEAGTDKPIIIQISTEKHSITIRDYGTGLSPERVKEVYCNIGSSTKRESNAYLGAFGIGHLSALSCTDAMHVQSYYNGTMYYYIVSKSGNSITTNLIQTSSTDEPNGVAITIQGIYDFCKYYDALGNIVFFNNVYIDCDSYSYSTVSDIRKINDSKIKRFKYFAANDQVNLKHHLLLGNVLYPIDLNYCTERSRAVLKRIENSGIAIKFDIGELNVTPNRENILYNSAATDILNDRIDKAGQEIEELALSVLKTDYDDIYEYRNAICTDLRKFDPFLSELSIYSGYKASSITKKFTYKGKALSEYSNFIYQLSVLPIPNLKMHVIGGRYKKQCSTFDQRYYRRANNILVVDSPLNRNLKYYLANNFNDYKITTSCSYEDFIKDTDGYILGSYDPATVEFILQSMYEDYLKRLTVFDPKTDPGYLSYREQCKKTPKAPLSNIIIYKHIYAFGTYRYDTTEALYNDLKEIKQGIILSTLKEFGEEDPVIISKCGYMFIKARQDIYDTILGFNLSQVKTYQWYINNCKMLAKMKALIPIWDDDRSFYNSSSKMIKTVPYSLQAPFNDVRKWLETIDCHKRYMKRIEEFPVPADSVMRYYGNLFYDYWLKYISASDKVELSGIEGDTAITAYLTKRKVYRVNNLVYSKYKNSLLKELFK